MIWSFTISSTTSNCPFLQAICNRVFHYVRLIDAVRLLDTLEYLLQAKILDFIPKVFLGLLFEGQGTENEAYIKIYLKSSVKSREFVPDYTFLSMLAEIGSYTGLLLGVSLVHITSLIDRIFVRLMKE